MQLDQELLEATLRLNGARRPVFVLQWHPLHMLLDSVQGVLVVLQVLLLFLLVK